MLSDDSSYFTGMMLSVVADLSQLEDGIQPCETCCEGTAVHCPLCPTTLFKPTDREKVVNHLKTHWHTRVQSLDGDSSFEFSSFIAYVVKYVNRRQDSCKTHFCSY